MTRILVVLGSLAVLVGVLDPLEGSVVILLGGVMVLLGTVLGRSPSCIIRYWLTVFVCVALGVGVLFALSSVGGLGGTTGHSMRWGLLILPYPLGWVAGVLDIFRRFSGFLKARHQGSATL